MPCQAQAARVTLRKEFISMPPQSAISIQSMVHFQLKDVKLEEISKLTFNQKFKLQVINNSATDVKGRS